MYRWMTISNTWKMQHHINYWCTKFLQHFWHCWMGDRKGIRPVNFFSKIYLEDAAKPGVISGKKTGWIKSQKQQQQQQAWLETFGTIQHHPLSTPSKFQSKSVALVRLTVWRLDVHAINSNSCSSSNGALSGTWVQQQDPPLHLCLSVYWLSISSNLVVKR